MKDILCTNNELDINYNSALKPPAIARLYNIIIYNALIPPKFKPFSLIFFLIYSKTWCFVTPLVEKAYLLIRCLFLFSL